MNAYQLAASLVVEFATETAKAQWAVNQNRESFTSDILNHTAQTTWTTEAAELVAKAIREQCKEAGIKRGNAYASDFKTLAMHSAIIDCSAKSWSREAQRIRELVRTPEEKQSALALLIKEKEEGLIKAQEDIASLKEQYAILTGTKHIVSAFDALAQLADGSEYQEGEQAPMVAYG